MSRFPPLPRPRDTSISLDTRSVAPMCRLGADGEHLPEVDTGFRVVLADPPWAFSSNSLAAPGRNPRRHYPCMTVEELCQLPLAERVARDAVLFLCVPGPLLVIGAHLPLIRAWGFRPTAWALCWSSCGRSQILQISRLPTFTLGQGSPLGRTPNTWCFASEAKACGVMPACTKLL